MKTIDVKTDEEIIENLQISNQSELWQKRIIEIFKSAVEKILKIQSNS